MGAIKEKMFEIAEIIQQMLDEGVKDFEVDEYLEVQLTPDDYQFYHQNKDVIFQHFLGFMGESVNEAMAPNIIRVFDTRKMRVSDSRDFRPEDIKQVLRTYTSYDSFGEEFYSTKVMLADGTSGYVWPDVLAENGIDPKTNKRNFDDMNESLMMPRLNELKGHSNEEPGDPNLVGKVFKRNWSFGETSYYMVLDDSYVPAEKGMTSGDKNRWHLTIRLAHEKNGRWQVPYSLKGDLYNLPGEKQGSQRSGYEDLSTNCEPITERDKKRLITLFSKPRYLNYLEEILEDEGFVPDFLEHLLNKNNESLTPRNPHINRNIEEDDPRWIDPHEWDRHRRFKEDELAHELAGEDECPTCGRHLDDSGHCRRCERRNESEFMMPSIFGKSLNEAKRDWTKDDAKRHGLENLWQDHDEDSFDEQEFLDNDADWTFQEGDEVIFDIEDMEMEWREDEEQGEIAISHSGQVAVIVAQVTATKIGDKDYEYYDIEFGDGTILDAVSGYHLKPAYEKPDISPAGEPDINFKNIRKYRNPYRESKEELMMPSLFEGCGCGKRRPSGIPIRKPTPRVKIPVPPKSPNKR